MIEITRQPIDANALLQKTLSPEAGAVVLFLGVTREFTRGRQTAWLEYECYEGMAEKKLAELEQQARRKWPLTECLITHRVGRVDLAEVSVAVAAASPHRRAAFEAGKWLIDTLKEVVPIWKQENWADGSQEWVHPGMTDASSAGGPPDAC